jgi:hypothetical protein
MLDIVYDKCSYQPMCIITVLVATSIELLFVVLWLKDLI